MEEQIPDKINPTFNFDAFKNEADKCIKSGSIEPILQIIFCAVKEIRSCRGNPVCLRIRQYREKYTQCQDCYSYFTIHNLTVL